MLDRQSDKGDVSLWRTAAVVRSVHECFKYILTPCFSATLVHHWSLLQLPWSRAVLHSMSCVIKVLFCIGRSYFCRKLSLFLIDRIVIGLLNFWCIGPVCKVSGLTGCCPAPMQTNTKHLFIVLLLNSAHTAASKTSEVTNIFMCALMFVHVQCCCLHCRRLFCLWAYGRLHKNCDGSAWTALYFHHVWCW